MAELRSKSHSQSRLLDRSLEGRHSRSEPVAEYTSVHGIMDKLGRFVYTGHSAAPSATE